MAPTPEPEKQPDETGVKITPVGNSTKDGFDPEKAARFVADLFVQEVLSYAKRQKKNMPRPFTFTPRRRGGKR